MPTSRFLFFSVRLIVRLPQLAGVLLVFLSSQREAAAQIGNIPELQRFLNGPVPDVPAIPPTSRQGEKGVFEAKPGPWGRLKSFYIYIEAPKKMVDDYPLPFSKPRWTFPESEVAALAGLFERAGLSEGMSRGLLNAAHWTRDSGMVNLFPSVSDIESMTPAARQIIYKELARYPTNEFHADPVLMTTDTAEEWFHSSKLRPELIAKISELSYLRGECLAFSDVQLMIGLAQSDSEARLIFKSFTRTRCLMVQMVVDDQTDLPALLDYWSVGVGGLRKDIEPIVQSIIDVDGVDSLGLTHIIPALPRKLLYTYPGSEFARHGLLPDCHWTSLNFFNYEPHEYLLDAKLATSAVVEKFQPVDGPYRYGDILFFVDSNKGDAFHSCVHLADDLVFTKNGRNAFSPWVIMRIADVEKIYLHDRNGRIQAYRHRFEAERRAEK